MLAAGVRVSPLLPSHGQAKEPSDTKHCRSKLRLKQTPAPPRVMHHAHSCQHFGFGLASWLFLRVRKKSWSPTVSFCPKPIRALADTVQTAGSKQIPQPEAFNKVPVTFLRAVQQWWQLRQPPSQPAAVRSREGCQRSWKDGGSIHLSCFQGSLWKATASHPWLQHPQPLGTKQPRGCQETEGGWRNFSSYGFWYGGKGRTAEGVGIRVLPQSNWELMPGNYPIKRSEISSCMRNKSILV